MLTERKILILIMLISACSLHAQNFTLKTFTTADGLPHNTVRAIARDSSGFLWVGTWDGLSRFDGHEFKNYFHEPGDSTTIPYFSIVDICVDKCNNLWINTDTRELVKYNRGTDDFTPVNWFNSRKNGKLLELSTDGSGNLLLLCQSGIFIFDPLVNKITEISLTGKDGKPFIPENLQHWITMDGDSAIWLTSGDVMEFRKSGSNEYRLLKQYPIEETIDMPLVNFDLAVWRSLYISRSGRIWLFSNNGLFRLDDETGYFMEYKDEFQKDEFTGREFFFWGKRGDGIHFFNRNNQRLTHIPDVQAKWPAVILADGRNSFWFSNSTSKGVALGISRVAFIPGFFRNFLIPVSDSSTPAVYSVIIDRGKSMWAGIRGFDHIVRFADDGAVSKLFFLPKESRGLSDYVRSLIPVKNGVWIGHYLNLLQFYDYESGKFTRHLTEGYTFRAIAVRSDGQIYIGTDELSIYDPDTGKKKVIWKSVEPVNIFRILIDANGIVWAGMSESRLLRYDPQTGKVNIIHVAVGTANIEDVVAGEAGDIWLALLGKGVCRYNTLKGTFKYYTTADGLSNNTTYSLLKDNQGQIWVSTNQGISMINPETEHIRVFNETDGIVISEFNSGAKFTSDDGDFLFGGMGGFIRFHPDSISLRTTSSRHRFLFTNFEVSGEERHIEGDLNEIDTIILERGENNFHISFSFTDFTNTEKTKFRYRLDPVNRKWTETGSRNRNINYSNLNPGWYKLSLEATDKNGRWTSSRNLTIRVKPSFYQTRLFLIVMPLLITGLIVFGIFLYIRQLKQKERSTQDELKLQSLRSQMNPHFIFNSLNSINYFISNNDRLSANRYIADFSGLIRSILSNMGSNFIPLENEINSLTDYLRIEHLRFGDKFDYTLDITGITSINEIEVCPGIVQPFIENAIWHGVRALEERKGKISIRFLKSGNEGLKCIIEDDGIGREASLKNKSKNGKHQPRGISIIEERLQITGKLRKTNYRLLISDLYPDKKETGTKVEVDIPCMYSKTRTSC